MALNLRSRPILIRCTPTLAKKIPCKTYYFGLWAHSTGALDNYLSEKDYLYNGLAPPEPKKTVGQVIASLLRHKQSQLDADDIAEVTFNEYATATM